MTQEFEGRTEQEAIDAAVEALGLDRHEFEVEILEEQKGGLFGRGKAVRIRVHLDDDAPGALYGGGKSSNKPPVKEVAASPAAVRIDGPNHPETDFEHAVVDFITTITDHMGFPATVVVAFREEHKLGLRLDTDHANILIGRKGKNLDALQLLASVVAARFTDSDIKVVIDTEGYRNRREEQLINLAHTVGDKVKRNGGSELLEPMNPFERRLIHTALNDIDDIGTESEGEGLYKQVRIFYRGR